MTAFAERALPATRLTRETDDLAGADRERHAVDRARRASPGHVVDDEILERDHGRRIRLGRRRA